LAPALREEELRRAVGARVAGRVVKAALAYRLVVEINLGERLEAKGLVYEQSGGVGVVGGHTRVHAGARGHFGDRPGRSRGRVDVLAVAEFMVVIERIVALRGKKRLEAVLAAGIHRDELLAIFPRIVVIELRLPRPVRRRGGERPAQSDRRRVAAGGFVD